MKAAPPLIRAAVLLRPSGGAARRPTGTQVKVKVKVADTHREQRHQIEVEPWRERKVEPSRRI